MKINLQDVIEAIEFENPMLKHYYNKKSGIIIYKEDESSAAYSAEDISRINELEEYEAEIVRGLYDLKENPHNYIQLPEKDETYELEMMKNFCDSFSDIVAEKIDFYNKDINKAVHDIKNIIRTKGLINEWYEYIEQTEKELAEDWCRENNIEFI